MKYSVTHESTTSYNTVITIIKADDVEDLIGTLYSGHSIDPAKVVKIEEYLEVNDTTIDRFPNG